MDTVITDIYRYGEVSLNIGFFAYHMEGISGEPAAYEASLAAAKG